MAALPARIFGPMEKSIGQEILVRFEASGMTQLAFAEKVAMHRNSLASLFTSTSVDTDRLMLACKALNFDFFALLSARYRSASSTSRVSDAEPPEYGRQNSSRGTLRLVIEMSDDDESRRRAADMVRSLGGAPEVSRSTTKD